MLFYVLKENIYILIITNINKMVEDTIFIRTFGNTPIWRVLMFLLENNIFDYPKIEIARNARVSRTTLNVFWKRLLKKGIVRETRRVGKATFYQINMENEIVKIMNALNNAICKAYSDEILEPIAAKG